MKEHRKARRLAEDIVFGNKKILTVEQKELLKNSPFSEVLSIIQQTDTKFSRLMESVVDSFDIKEDEKKSKNATRPAKRGNRLFTGLDKGELCELKDCIEDHFKLSVPYDYNSFDLEQLKQFIADYAENQIFDEQTQRLVLRIKDKNSPEEIMGTLRLYC